MNNESGAKHPTLAVIAIAQAKKCKTIRRFDGNQRSLQCVQLIGTAPAPFLLRDKRQTEGRAFVPAFEVKGDL
jgi:hypothetical protein